MDKALEQATTRLILALAEFLVAVKQSQAAQVGARPAPTQCDGGAAAMPLRAVGQMLTPAPEYAPIQREHLPVRCSADMEGHRL